MKLLSKRKSNAGQKPDAISKGVNTILEHIRTSWVRWMAKHTEHLSRSTWIVLLALFILSTSFYSVFLLVNGLGKKAGGSMVVTHIKRPKYIAETAERRDENAELSKAEYERIRKFRAYMDSLARSPSGRKLYDSITRRRPGLMDSIRFIEQYYQQLKR